MIARYRHLSRHPGPFRALTGLDVAAFDALADELVPVIERALLGRRQRPGRTRRVGGGRPCELDARDRLLLVVVWLRRYPTYEVLGFLFGVAKAIVGRAVAEVLPLLEAAGRDTMRMPDPGKHRRHTLDALLAATPELAVIVDTFEQPVQRPTERAEADRWYSGKKKRHCAKKLGKGGRDSNSETFRWNPAGIQSRPAELGQQPEASLARGGATLTAKRRQPVPRPCD